jgi:hypothetical protein
MEEKYDTSYNQQVMIFKVQPFEEAELWKITNARLIVGLVRNLKIEGFVLKMLTK